MIFPYLNGEPVLPIQIKNHSGNWITFHGYLDSGAAYSVFHVDVAEILGVKIYQGRKIYLTVGDGAKIETYIHQLLVKFGGKELAAEISFSPSLGTGTNILGMKSFFDHFHICFNNKELQVSVTPF